MSDGSMEAWWQSSQLDSANSAYLEYMYEDFIEDPSQVPTSWRDYFTKLSNSAVNNEVIHSEVREAFKALAKHPSLITAESGGVGEGVTFSRVIRMLYDYRTYGHLEAELDPLELWHRDEEVQLTLAHKKLSSANLEETFALPGFFHGKAFKLKEIIAQLRRIYCCHIGFEYMHITNEIERLWLRDQIEVSQDAVTISAQEQQWLLQRLVAADGLERYLGMRYVGQKRFSLEGGDSLIPMMDYIMHESCDHGIKEAVIGMAHRGRLNVLVNVMGKSPESLFAEFDGKHYSDLLSGDVKYHNGFSSDIETKGGKLHMVLAFNPSHLEIVNPVVEGSVRARMDRRCDSQGDQVIAVQIHGDAAFAAQGVVMETLNMAQCPGYTTHGSIHIVINNQVGFTTSCHKEARSTTYCTDIGKMMEVPIFHVNGDYPEAVLRVVKLAFAYRQQFRKDVIIDLVCYRRLGHNESDGPMATQPLMYQVIQKLPVPAKRYAQQLKEAGVIQATMVEQLSNDYKISLEKGEPVKAVIPASQNAKFIVDWAPFIGVPWDTACATKMDKKRLTQIAQKLDQLPKDFMLQKQVGKILAERARMTKGELPINWGYAEILAYATLVADGVPVRLSGEDCGRGTFSHRHAVLHNQTTDQTYVPLNHISKDQAQFIVINSLLSEEAVMAFEYGYSSSDPQSLVLWEAQFGDFANVAQVVIDQFISSAEEKWGRLAGLTLLLPHGQEGMGAEHSSARLERYLQLCANNNIQVCVPTTPAQMYHMIRRQMVRPYRKPLIVMTPKSLLRHPLVTSTFDDLANGQFHTVMDESDRIVSKQVRRVVLCQGKVYYDLLDKRRNTNINDIAVIRIEQLYPFPYEQLKSVLHSYKHVQDIVWCQEEPINQGAWYIIGPRIKEVLLREQNLQYVGREAFASPAVGYPSLFREQQELLVAQALQLKKNTVKK